MSGGERSESTNGLAGIGFDTALLGNCRKNKSGNVIPILSFVFSLL